MHVSALDDLLQDLRYAIRALRATPGFTAFTVLILALGIGANTAIFSLVSAVLLRPLPFEEPDRVVILWEDITAIGGGSRVEPSPANYVDWKVRSRSFTDMALLERLNYNLTGGGEPERISGLRTTVNLFDILGMPPLLGRTFRPEDDGPDALPVAVVGESFWIQRYGADPDLVGRGIVLDGLERTVIGIVPTSFRFPSDDAAVWIPAAYTPEELGRRNQHSNYVVGRLRPGVTQSMAQTEMSTIAAAMQQELPNANGRADVTLTSLQEQLARSVRPTLVILLASVGVILLITCANVANLLLVRGARRVREFAIRAAVGATRGRVLRQLLAESTVLAAAGLAVGVGFATSSFAYLARLIPNTFPDGAIHVLDWRVFFFTAAVSLLAVMLFGAGPALVSARSGSQEVLKRTVGGSFGPRRGRLRDTLVVAEVTLTIVLLAAAGLLLRSYVAVLATDPGFRPDNLLIAEMVLPPTKYATHANRIDFYRRVLERVTALPGVVAAGFVNTAPLGLEGGRSFVSIEGRPRPQPEEFARFVVNDRVVSSNYLATLGVPLVRGRQLDSRDAADAPGSVLINEAMARALWPNEDPVGKRMRLGVPGNQTPWITIVGVVGDVRQVSLDAAALPEFYRPLEQADSGPFYWPRELVVRTQVDPMTLGVPVRSAVWDVDASQPVSTVRSMAEVLDAKLANRNTQLTLVGAFAGLALLLAAVGLYGVLSYSVAQRTSEIAVRIALGARVGTVVRSVMWHALLLASIGIILGLGATAAATRLLASFLFGVSQTDPLTLVSVAGLFVLVTVFASSIPAVRAARVDPALALRSD